MRMLRLLGFHNDGGSEGKGKVATAYEVEFRIRVDHCFLRKRGVWSTNIRENCGVT